MGFMDSLRSLVTKGKDSLVAAGAKAGQYMEDTSSKLVGKIPGGNTFKEKASQATQASVDWIGKESKELAKEGEELLAKRKKAAEAEAAAKKASEPVAKAAEPGLAKQIEKGISDQMK